MAQDKKASPGGAPESLRLVIALEKRTELDSHAPFETREFLLERSHTTIGRRPYNDIVLDHITVSGEHAMLERKGAGFEIVDTGSSNGSFVNGKRVSRKAIRPGDYIGIGIYQLQMVSDALHSPVTIPAAGVDDIKNAQIVYLNGPLRGIAQPVNRSIVKIGRGSEVAVIGRRRDGHYLTHLEGLKPTLLNGEPVTVGSRNLCHGDLIQLGETQLRFSEVAATTQSS